MACARCLCETVTHSLNGLTWQVPVEEHCYRCEIMDDELDFMIQVYTDLGPWAPYHTGQAWALHQYKAGYLVERALEVFKDKAVATRHAAWLNYWIHRARLDEGNR